MPENNLRGEFVLSPEKNTEKPEKPTENISENPSSDEGKKPHSHGHSNAHFFSSLCYYPSNVTFKDQDVDEEVVLLIRRDFITNLPWIIGAIGLIFLPVLISLISPFLPQFLIIPPMLLTVSLIFYYVVVFAFILLQFTIWYFNVGIVTNKRIIDLDVVNILVHELTEARLEAVQDVTLIQIGGIRSIFHYGDIDIQTEAIKQNIEFHRAPDPNFIRKVIGELIVDRQTT